MFCRGTPPQATFLFKHALVRDVAYGSLLRGQRQQLHGRIADVLAEQFPTTVEAEPEVLEHVSPKLNRWGSMGFTGRSG